LTEKEQLTREWVKALKMAVQLVATREDSKQRFSNHGSMNSDDTTMFHEAKTIVQTFSTQPEVANNEIPQRNSMEPVKRSSINSK